MVSEALRSPGVLGLEHEDLPGTQRQVKQTVRCGVYPAAVQTGLTDGSCVGVREEPGLAHSQGPAHVPGSGLAAPWLQPEADGQEAIPTGCAE